MLVEKLKTKVHVWPLRTHTERFVCVAFYNNRKKHSRPYDWRFEFKLDEGGEVIGGRIVYGFPPTHFDDRAKEMVTKIVTWHACSVVARFLGEENERIMAAL